MSQKEFDNLLEYSCSIPTGVYDWKRWKCDINFGTELPPDWYMFIYIPCTVDPGKCKYKTQHTHHINRYSIRIVEMHEVKRN